MKTMADKPQFSPEELAHFAKYDTREDKKVKVAEALRQRAKVKADHEAAVKSGVACPHCGGSLVKAKKTAKTEDK